MENLERCLTFREKLDDEILLGVDDVSQIEEGSLFGLIFSKGDLCCIYPSSCYNGDHNIEYFLNCDDLESFDIEPDNESLNEDLPFIFRKMKGNLAQEVLSGETFVLSGRSEDKEANGLEIELTSEEFQNVEPRYSNNNVLINCGAIEYGTKKFIPNAFIQINDDFKASFSYYTLPNKEKIIEAIKSIKKLVKKEFADCLTNCIDEAQYIAETDNFLYDLEHSEYKPKAR